MMKKLKVVVVALSLLLAGNVSMAQTKIGYIDAETVLYLMPEVAKIDSLVQIYQRDTVGKEYNVSDANLPVQGQYLPCRFS